MTTANDIIERFYHYIENDIDFFNYFNLNESQCMEVAHQRSSILLTEAASYLCTKIGTNSVFLMDVDINGFKEVLNLVEIDLLVKAMFLCYLKRDLATLRTFQGVLTSSDLNIYSPANERKTFMDMVSTYESELKISISEYCMIDRKTGMYRQICN